MTLAYGSAAAAFVAYAVWGTLFPFDFHAVPLETAARLFWHGAAGAGSLSLTDLVSNVLLFLPIGLFTSAALEASRNRGTAPFSIALLTLIPAIALSGTIEFAQAFVSWRTPSVVDVAAEAIGAASGIAIWHYLRAEIDALLRSGLRTVGRSTPFERMLLACCAVFAIGWWLPADFTLRPSEIGDKYLHKRLLWPFAPSPDAAGAVRLMTIAAAAIPIGLAAGLCGVGSRRRSVASGALLAATALVALELVQIPVFSRTTDATELLAAVAGSTAGSAAAAFADRATVVGVDWRVVRTAAIIAAAVGLACVFEWWPFRITTDAQRAFLAATQWSRTPFRWPASVADVLPGVILAAAAGWVVRPRLDPRFVRIQTMLVAGCAGIVFVVCEGGRVLLMGGRPTLTSVLLKLSALACGLYLGSASTSDRLHPREAR